MVNPLSILWTGKCTIYEFENVTDPETFQTTQREVVVLNNEPCRLSYNHEQATNIQSGAAVVSQSITLFIRPDLTIKPGCRATLLTDCSTALIATRLPTRW